MEVREKQEKIDELIADLKHLNEEMEAKDDEVMHAYQRYTKEKSAQDLVVKELKKKNQELEK